MDRADANGLFSSPASDGGSAGGGRPVLFSLSSSAPAVEHHAAAGTGFRRKRGRPRKYGTAPSSSSSAASAAPVMKALSHLLSPRQQAPPAQPPSSSGRSRKDGAFTSSASSSSSRKAQLAALGTAGQGFRPLVITVAAGEDITQRITSSTQQHKHAFCILSASGSISSASLCQPEVGGCVTYEGIFEIISLSGSFLHTETGGAPSRIGGLSICLSGADGRVVGGGVGGPLLAFGPVQVIAGSFVVDIDSTKPTDDSVSNLSTSSQFGTNLLTSVTLNFTSESAGLISSSGNDNNHNFTGSQNYYMVQHPMHLLPPRSSIDWRDDDENIDG